MGYASLTSGYKGITRKHKALQCLGVNISRVTSTDQQGNVTTLSEIRTPVIARTIETVEEYVGLSDTVANGDGPTITGHGGKKFQPHVEVNASGTNPFVTYERTVDVAKVGDSSLRDVTVTIKESTIVQS